MRLCSGWPRFLSEPSIESLQRELDGVTVWSSSRSSANVFHGFCRAGRPGRKREHTAHCISPILSLPFLSLPSLSVLNPHPNRTHVLRCPRWEFRRNHQNAAPPAHTRPWSGPLKGAGQKPSAGRGREARRLHRNSYLGQRKTRASLQRIYRE